MADHFRPRQLLTLAVICLVPACKGARSAKTDATTEPRCDTTTLARALATDTTKLSRQQREASSGGAAGGFTAIAYYDITGRRRVLAAIYYGETGQKRYTFSFLTPVDYAVRIVEEHYAAPMSGIVASRSEATRYVCGGLEQQGTTSRSDTVDVAGVLAEADSLLQRSR